MPLIKSFALSAKKAREWCFEPIIDRTAKTISYNTRSGKPSRGGTIDRRGAQCLVCSEPVAISYVRSEGKAGRIGTQMTAIVAEGQRERVYLPPSEDHVEIARTAAPAWAPETDLAYNPRHMSPPLYGITKHRDLFTSRQLLALTTLSDIVRQCRDRVVTDAVNAGMKNDNVALDSGGSEASAYADAITTYLALGVSRLSDTCNALCSWGSTKTQVKHLFTRSAISMIWDFVEPNVFSKSAGDYSVSISNLARALRSVPASQWAMIRQADAASLGETEGTMFATDPPYYDNVPYADLSDFFYVWLRSNLAGLFPDLFATLLVPKAEEIVADPSRFGGSKERAREFFERSLGGAFRCMGDASSSSLPTTIFYAFKDTEATGQEDRSAPESLPNRELVSAGWEAMLNGLLSAGFRIVGTWPMTSELANRIRGQNSNALASSIVLVCRPRSKEALRVTRADFSAELRAELPTALRRLRDASLAATDLEQAAIGPGMSVFSRYQDVLEPDGKAMSVRSALALINQELAQILLGEIADVDPETHFALTWFDGHFYDEAKFGEADVLLKAKNANLAPLRDAGVVRADRGVVQLIRPIGSKRRMGGDPDREVPDTSSLGTVDLPHSGTHIRRWR
jgi:putative DNA methylase